MRRTTRRHVAFAAQSRVTIQCHIIYSEDPRAARTRADVILAHGGVVDSASVSPEVDIWSRALDARHPSVIDANVGEGDAHHLRVIARSARRIETRLATLPSMQELTSGARYLDCRRRG